MCVQGEMKEPAPSLQLSTLMVLVAAGGQMMPKGKEAFPYHLAALFGRTSTTLTLDIVQSTTHYVSRGWVVCNSKLIQLIGQ